MPVATRAPSLEDEFFLAHEAEDALPEALRARLAVRESQTSWEDVQRHLGADPGSVGSSRRGEMAQREGRRRYYFRTKRFHIVNFQSKCG